MDIVVVALACVDRSIDVISLSDDSIAQSQYVVPGAFDGVEVAEYAVEVALDDGVGIALN